jgi:hypothetical protein
MMHLVLIDEDEQPIQKYVFEFKNWLPKTDSETPITKDQLELALRTCFIKVNTIQLTEYLSSNYFIAESESDCGFIPIIFRIRI